MEGKEDELDVGGREGESVFGGKGAGDCEKRRLSGHKGNVSESCGGAMNNNKRESLFNLSEKSYLRIN